MGFLLKFETTFNWKICELGCFFTNNSCSLTKGVAITMQFLDVIVVKKFIAILIPFPSNNSL